MTTPITPDTLIIVKVSFEGNYRKFKLPLRDLGPNVLPSKLHNFLGIPPNVEVIYERYSDSAAHFVHLDPNDPAIYKQLYRAAKAKLRLRLRATIVKSSMEVPLSNGPTGTDQSGAQAADAGQATVSDNGNQTTHPRDNVASSESVSSPVSKEPSSIEAQPAMSQPAMAQPGVPQPAVSGLHVVRDNVIKVIPPVHGYPVSVGQLPGPSYAVYCNVCDSPIGNEHYHCSICADGDFDLCCDCVDAGNLCDHEDHWLIKRSINNGVVINSTTERLAPQKKVSEMDPSRLSTVQKETAETAEQDILDINDDGVEYDVTARTCNGCVEVFPEATFVECTVCEDYDLCIQCLLDMKHGHNPSHGFKPATEDTIMDDVARALCAPGRNLRHYALCDGCDKTIVGIRHKCLDCPDWDYCSACVPSAPYIHPGHRFVQVVETLKFKTSQDPRHLGKLCDGPLCTEKRNQVFIVGDRYKCTVCHDTDFCSRCEASPVNHHNKTHPMIKFKTPVRNVTVSTIHERPGGGDTPILGDRPTSMRRTATTPSTPRPSTNTATPVKTVVDVKPVNSSVSDSKQNQSSLTMTGNSEDSNELNALYVRDTVADGTRLPPNEVFSQTWTIQNPGPASWPKGCTVKFVGGDNMRNIDMSRPVSVADLERSIGSNSCPFALEANSRWSFTVTLKTPNREGKCISYWRLTAPNGVKFGHKLWCDIDVAQRMTTQSPSQSQTTENPNVPCTATLPDSPKVEKESPVVTDAAELVSEVESLKLEDDESEELFLTDEEYDILDASDEEFLTVAQKGVQK
ncbi:MAG: hypothetical protein M1816_006935 [Peltula sp. TS41687]|nr:MAG: hypothetical protein M1816_006935 [Peltula sp. TS41687]